MKSGRVLSGMMVGLMLWTSLIQFGCAAKNPVFDYCGEVITEEEIKANKRNTGRVAGGCLGGGCLGMLSLFGIADAISKGEIRENENEHFVTTISAVIAAFTIIGATTGWWIGSRNDRQGAIERIRLHRAIKRAEEKRREPDMP